MEKIETKFINLLSIILIFIFSGCTSLWGESEDIRLGLKWTDTPTPFLPYAPKTTIEIPTLIPTTFTVFSTQIEPIVENATIWIGGSVSPLLRKYLTDSGFQVTNEKSKAFYNLDTNKLDENNQTTTWIYVLVAPFPTIIDNVVWMDIINSWQGEKNNPFGDDSIRMDFATFNALCSILGFPDSGNIIVDTSGSLLKSAWDDQPSWAIVPFEDLEPRWKVISIDGRSPISNDFELENYPLKVNFNLQAVNPLPVLILPDSNRDPKKLTSLVMTGVTALVRATAGKMEHNGVLYPGKDIRTWLVSADLTHISNEIPFADECPYPDPNQKTLVFCSDPKYIALLEDVGTDIVELTGNHFQDWGSEATLSTLAMYNHEGWIYFGGGVDLIDARASKIVIHNGNKLAFMGCNPAGPQYAWATNYQPGASPCDFDWIFSEISRLVSEGYLPIVTFQYIESYSVNPLPDQVEDFRAMATAGAVIISGSQAHLPQTMEFINKSFIHYGLGNLFFDQIDYPVVGTRREFIDRHVFYDGKYLGTELLTALLEDYSRPRPMTAEERSNFLNEIFTTSGW